MVEITKKNVTERWGLYSEYVEHYETNWRDDKYMNFEEFVDSRIIQCEGCEEYYDVEDDYVRSLEDGSRICEQCMTNGWGQ